MEKKFLLLVLVLCLIFIFAIRFVSATDISACGDLSADTYYNLTQSVSNAGTCFTAAGDNFVLDCQGYTITYGTNEGHAVVVSGYHNITVKNCVVSEATDDYDFDYAVYFLNAANGTIKNNTITTVGYDARTIFLYESVNFSIANNTMVTPMSNSLTIFGNSTDHFNHTIDMSNLAEGKAIIYNFSLNDSYVYQNQNLSDTCGQLICAACNNVTYENITMNLDGISFFNTSNSKIQKCNISTADGHPIRVESYSYKNLITENHVENVGSNQYRKGIAICFYSTFNNITSNNITIHNRHGDGVYLRTYANNNYIFNNTIDTNGYQGYGLFFRGQSNLNTIEGNNVTCNKDNSQGISFYNASHSIVKNNNFTTKWQYARGLHIGLYSENLTFINNSCNSTNAFALWIEPQNNVAYYNHTMTGNTEDGKPLYYYFNNDSIIIENDENIGQIYVAASNNITIRNLTFIKDGVVLAMVTNSTIENNTFNISISESDWCTYCNYYEGAITMHYSSGLTIDNNTIIAHGKSLYGIFPRYTSNLTVINNNINSTGTSGYGIYLKDSSYSINVVNNTITTYRDNGYGMYIRVNSNTIKGNSIKTRNKTGAYGIYLSSATGNDIYDTIINATNSSDIYIVGTGTNNLTNCTFGKNNVSYHTSATGKINIKWYMDVFVNYSTGSIASDASVKAYNVNNSLTFTDITDSTGYITRQNITEYYQNKTKKYYQANYSINASYNSAYSETESNNISRNTIGDEKIVLTINDTENPVPSLTIIPSSIVLEGSSTINCSGTDTNSSGLASVIASSSENSSICSNSSCSGSSCSCLASSYVPTYVGIHLITCLVTDNSANSNGVAGNLEVTQGTDGVGGSLGGGRDSEPPEEAEEIKEEPQEEEEKVEEEEEIIEEEKGIIQICKKNLLLCIFGILLLISLIITTILFIYKNKSKKRKKFRFFK